MSKTVKTTVIRGMATQMVAAASLLVLLAAAILLVAVYDAEWYVGLYAVLIGMGIVLIALSFVPGRGVYGRSSSDMRLVWGVLIAMIGAIGIVNVYVSSELWVSAVLVLLTLAVLVLILMMKGLIRAKG